jgi:hypothetical protein
MRVVLADSSRVWRVMNYLQRDAVSKGVLKCKDNDTRSNFLVPGTTWTNLWKPKRQFRLYVVLDASHHLIAYFIARWSLEHDGREGTLPVDIFEVLPKYRKQGVGSFIVCCLRDKACTAGFDSLKVLPANGSDDFWNKKGFSSWGDSHGFLSLPIA